MKKLYCVYKHTAPNGKIYIGITSQKVEDRWQRGKGYKYNEHFFRAIKKYGWDNIKHEIIASRLNEKDAKEMERFFVCLYKSYDSHYGYNKTHGGDDVVVNIEKRIIQYNMSGEFVNEYASLTDAAQKTHTNISRISDCANGKRFTTNGFIWLFKDDKQREEQLRVKIKEKKHPSAMCEGANHQARPVEQYEVDGTYIKTYPSAQTAANSIGIHYSTISACAIGKKKCITAGGYIWIYADDPDKQKRVNDTVKKYNNSGCKRPVFQYSLDGKFVAEYSSIKDAGDVLHKNSSHIGDACRGNRNTAYGYKWKFADSRT